jgi:hypothetical protein
VRVILGIYLGSVLCPVPSSLIVGVIYLRRGKEEVKVQARRHTRLGFLKTTCEAPLRVTDDSLNDDQLRNHRDVDEGNQHKQWLR